VAEWTKRLALVCATLLLLEGAFRAFHDERVGYPRMAVYEGKAVPWCCPAMVEKYGLTVFAPSIRFEHCYYGDDGRGDNERGPDGEHCVAYRTNREGFRDTDHAHEKPLGRSRILLLGDSFSFGEGVRDGRTYFDRLAADSSQEHAASVEWLNMALSGMDAATSRTLFFETAAAYRPDLVIFQWNTNDIAGAKSEHAKHIGRDYAEMVIRAQRIRWSAIYRYVWLSLHRLAFSRQLIELQTDPAQVRAGFEDIARLAQEIESQSAEFLVLIFPEIVAFDAYPYQDVVDSLEHFLDERGIDYLNTLPALMQHDAAALWVHPTDHHPNALAHRVVFDEVKRHVDVWLDGAGRRAG